MMRYKQPGGVKRVGDTDEYRVVVEVFLTAAERDLWGAGRARLVLEVRCPKHDQRQAGMLLRHVCGAMMISCPQCGESRCPACEPLR